MRRDEQFRMIDVPRWPQAVRIEFERRTQDDQTADAPDQMQDGFWPSHDRSAAGYVPRKDFAEAQAQAEARMAAWKAGDWGYVGVQAVATVYVPVGGGSFACYAFHSPGVWGVESDSGDDYLNELFEEEKEEVRSHLAKIGQALMPVEFTARSMAARVLAVVDTIDAKLNDENQPGGPRAPTGDDYNELWSAVRHVCQAALKEA